MGDFFDVLKREFGKGIREGLRPHVASALKEMYGSVLDVQSEDYWNREAETLLALMRDRARRQKASKK